MSKGIIADAFGVSYETVDADIIKAKELKVGNAVRTLEEAVKESRHQRHRISQTCFAPRGVEKDGSLTLEGH